MALSKITTHAADAVDRLNQARKGKTNLEALIKALASGTQKVENAFYQLYAERTIDAAVGAQLDLLGKIVGQNRESATDAQYRLRLKARVRANKASGTVEDLIAVFRALLGSVDAVRIEQLYPASLILELEDAPIPAADVSIYVKFLTDARAAGVNAQLHTSEHAAANTFTLNRLTKITADYDPPGTGILEVISTDGFPESGTLVLSYGEAFAETVTYSSKTATSFNGLSATASAHGVDDQVLQGHSADQALSSTSSPTEGGHLSTISQA